MTTRKRGSVHLGKDESPMRRDVNRDGGLVHMPTMDRVSERPFTWKAQIPITMQHARLQMCMWTGAFMTLGDADNFDMREAIVNECNTVALGSALIGTVMIANMMLMPGYEAADWIEAQGWYEDMVTFFLRSWQPIHLVLITMQIMSMVYCVFILIALGELTGDAEVRAFAMRIGMKLSGGFVLFFVSLVGYATWMVLFAVVHNEYSAEALCYTLIPFMFTALGLAYGLFMPVLMELYNVKFESSISQPLVMGRIELREALDLFVRSIGDPRKISPSNFQMFLVEQRAIQMQKKVLHFFHAHSPVAILHPCPGVQSPLRQLAVFRTDILKFPVLLQALVFWCTKQDDLVADSLLSRWKVEDHGEWINMFEELDPASKVPINQILDAVSGKKPGPDAPRAAVMSARDRNIVSRLKECKIVSMGVASISYMTEKLIEEEVDLLFQKVYGDGSDAVSLDGPQIQAGKIQSRDIQVQPGSQSGSVAGGGPGALVYKASGPPAFHAAGPNAYAAPGQVFNQHAQNRGYYMGMGI